MRKRLGAWTKSLKSGAAVKAVHELGPQDGVGYFAESHRQDSGPMPHRQRRPKSAPGPSRANKRGRPQRPGLGVAQ